jgi:hypothetical protein
VSCNGDKPPTLSPAPDLVSIIFSGDAVLARVSTLVNKNHNSPRVGKGNILKTVVPSWKFSRLYLVSADLLSPGIFM